PHGWQLEQAGRDLVEQRLEGVVVVAVDEDDLGVCVPQLVRGADAGEATAEDEDAGTGGGRAHVIAFQQRPSLIAGPRSRSPTRRARARRPPRCGTRSAGRSWAPPRGSVG